MEFIFKNENNMSLFELNIVFFNIRYPVKISRNGNAIKTGKRTAEDKYLKS